MDQAAEEDVTQAAGLEVEQAVEEDATVGITEHNYTTRSIGGRICRKDDNRLLFCGIFYGSILEILFELIRSFFLISLMRVGR